MWAKLITLFSFISVDLVSKLLLGAGLGLASAAFFKVLINMIITKVINQLGGVGASILGLLGMFGLDKCLSIIIGALIMRAYINAVQVGIKKA